MTAARRLDPITFEVVKNALSSLADEMALVIMRSAYSPVVRDSMDYSTALCDRHGQIIAQGLTLAVQLGAFPDGMRHLLWLNCQRRTLRFFIRDTVAIIRRKIFGRT